MSDSGGGAPSQFAGEVKQVAQEVVEDVKDQVGEAIEQGVKSITGQQLTPQQIQQKEEERQKELAETRWKIEQFKKTEQGVQQVRDQREQQEDQRKQQEDQQKQEAFARAQEDQSQSIVSPAKQEPQAPGQKVEQREEIKRSKSELRTGHGIGG